MKLFMLAIIVMGINSCKDEKAYNPYLEDGMSFKTEAPLFSYKGKDVLYQGLPPELGLSAYRAEQEKFEKLKHEIEAYYARVEFKKQFSMVFADEGERKKVPTLVDVYNFIFKEENFEKYYRELKLPNVSEKEDAQRKGKLKFDYTVAKISEILMQKKEEMYQEKILKLKMLPPNIHNYGVKFENFPSVGNKESKNQLMVFSNPRCNGCQKINKEVANVFKSFKGDLNYTHIDFVSKLTNVDGDLLKSRFCINQNFSESYWKAQSLAYDSGKLITLNEYDREGFKALFEAMIDELKIDKKDFYECMSEDWINKKMTEHFTLANQIGVYEPPVAFFNGRKIDLSIGLEKGIEQIYPLLNQSN